MTLVVWNLYQSCEKPVSWYLRIPDIFRQESGHFFSENIDCGSELVELAGSAVINYIK